MSTLDTRIVPYRIDLAADFLEGHVEARRFVKGLRHQVRDGVLDMHQAPQRRATLVSQLLFGETFTVYEHRRGWAWGQSSRDNYVGYVRADGLTRRLITPSHWVSALATHIYTAPDLKSAVRAQLSMASLIRLKEGDIEAGFRQLSTGGWIFAKHCTPLGSVTPDYVATARLFLNVPYRWGGRSAWGVDCSGLVQIAMISAGLKVPRDTDMQAASLGKPLAMPGNAQHHRRGDLVFFPGHVGIMQDETTLLHANAFDMRVSCHPLSEVIARVAHETANPAITVRRLAAAPNQ